MNTMPILSLYSSHLEGELSFFASAVGLDGDVAFSFGGIIEGAIHRLARPQH